MTIGAWNTDPDPAAQAAGVAFGSLGLLRGLPIEDYHRSPAVSCSGLHDFARSPFHYHALHLNPQRPPEKRKESQIEGNLAHCAILEPAEFERRYVIGPCEDARLKEWKEWGLELDEHEDTRTRIKRSQAQAALAMAESVRSIPDVRELLGAGEPEVSAFWIDRRTGEYCRCRPDWVHPVSHRGCILVDVKTYSDARPSEFARQIPRMGYHRQAAWYSDGYAQTSGLEVFGFVFVTVETAWPFAASAVMLDDQSIEAARKENAALLDRLAQCRRTGSWPAFSGIELVTLPAWATYREDTTA